MSTFPSHENSTSDFLQLEPIAHGQPETNGRQMAEHSSVTTTSDENLDVDKELSSLFELMGQQSLPTGYHDRNSSPELQAESQRLLNLVAETHRQLATIQQTNQEKFSALEQNFSHSEQLHQRTEQLAKYSKLQVRQLQEMLQSFELVRQEIVTSLDKFGSYDRIQPLVQQIQRAEQSLNQANEGFQEIHQQVEQRGEAFEQSFQQKQADLKKLVQAIREDRERVINIEQLVNSRLTQADRLHQDLTALKTDLEAKSTTVENNLTDINSNFASLAESVQHEKQQFYQLTAEMINKTDAMRSQFAEQAKQVSKYWEAIQSLQFRVDDLDDRVDSETQTQLQNLSQRHEEIISTWGDLKNKQKNIDRHHRNQQAWLQGLTAGLGISILMLALLLIKTFFFVR
jgi:chromosome segregation ATPase